MELANVLFFKRRLPEEFLRTSAWEAGTRPVDRLIKDRGVLHFLDRSGEVGGVNNPFYEYSLFFPDELF